MHITWSGFGAFKIQDNNFTILFDPVDEGSNFKLRKSNTDVLLLSHEVTKGDRSCVSNAAFIIDSPGEYEVGGAFIKGLAYNGQAVLYIIRWNDLSFVWLGPIHNKVLSNGLLEEIKDADILMIPVGGGSVLSAKEAATVINQIEPRLVLPCHYKIKGSKGLDSLEIFFKEYSTPFEKLDKLKISRKDLVSEDTRVVVLNS